MRFGPLRPKLTGLLKPFGGVGVIVPVALEAPGSEPGAPEARLDRNRGLVTAGSVRAAPQRRQGVAQIASEPGVTRRPACRLLEKRKRLRRAS